MKLTDFDEEIKSISLEIQRALTNKLKGLPKIVSIEVTIYTSILALKCCHQLLDSLEYLILQISIDTMLSEEFIHYHLPHETNQHLYPEFKKNRFMEYLDQIRGCVDHTFEPDFSVPFYHFFNEEINYEGVYPFDSKLPSNFEFAQLMKKLTVSFHHQIKNYLIEHVTSVRKST